MNRVFEGLAPRCARGADSDRVRRARGASQSAGVHRNFDKSRMKGFAARAARPCRAQRGRRRVRGVRGAILCIVYGVEYHIQRP